MGADGAAGWECLDDIVAEGVARMGAEAVGLVDFGGSGAGGIDGPGDLFEIFDELDAAGIDEQADVAGGVAKAAVDTSDAIAHERVGLGDVGSGFIDTLLVAHELADEIPIRAGGGGAMLIAARVGVDVDVEGHVVPGNLLDEGLGSFEEGLAGGLGVGVGQNDFIDDMQDVVNALDEEHAHWVDIEIDGPHEWIVRFEFDVTEMKGAIKGVVDAVTGDGGEFSTVLLTERSGVHLTGGALEFVMIDEAALFGGEVKRRPIGISFGVFGKVIKMIAAERGADEESAAFAVGEGRTEDFGPHFGLHGGEFVEDHEIDAVATEFVGFEAAVDAEVGAITETDAGFGFAGNLGPIRAGERFETIPNDALRLTISGAHVPHGFVRLQSDFDHFRKGEMRFTKAAAGD